jgi:cation diffusion facilitator CzcD-associated flavoprotein CzcO
MDEVDVIVIGAGMAGLACGARLRGRGLQSFCILDHGDSVGSAWRGRYERLSLLSPYHDLPDDGGLRDRWGIAFHRTELIAYLEAYAELHKLGQVLRFRESVLSIARGSRSWEVRTTGGSYTAQFVIVATSVSRFPYLPEISGQQRFHGRSLHSAGYWNATPFRNESVLVVGSGNSAADIALDLIEGGAQSVTLAVRAPRHLLNRDAYMRAASMARRTGMGFTPQTLVQLHRYTHVNREWPKLLSDQDKFLEAFAIDLSQHGIHRPAEGPATQTHNAGRESWYDMGTAREIQSGNIQVIDGTVDAIENFTETGVRFTSGERHYDSVIFGTGFLPRLEELVEEEFLEWNNLRRCLMPKTDGRCRSTVQPSLFFPGFDETPNGGLSLGLWGAEVADRVANELGHHNGARDRSE